MMSDTISLALRIAELEQSIALRDTRIEALSARLSAVQPLESAIASLLTAAHKQAIDKAVAEYTEQAISVALKDIDMSDLVSKAVMSEVAECLPAVAEGAVQSYDFSDVIESAIDSAMSQCTVRVSF